jgi:hypothetical protein
MEFLKELNLMQTKMETTTECKITVEINKANETVLFTTQLEVDGKRLMFSNTHLLGYKTPKNLEAPTFEEVFYWPKAAYTNPSLNHFMRRRLHDTNYNNINHVKYEVQWKEIDLSKSFTKPKNWIPGKQSFFDHYKRIPRKLKKRAKRFSNKKCDDTLDLGNKLWYLQHLENPNYNRFLITLIK